MNELTNRIMCIQMRSGIEIWIEDEQIEQVKSILKSSSRDMRFIQLPDGQLVNIADITGIFSAPTMEEVTNRKNGKWKCNHNNWHNRGEKCECAWEERRQREREEQRRKYGV